MFPIIIDCILIKYFYYQNGIIKNTMFFFYILSFILAYKKGTCVIGISEFSISKKLRHITCIKMTTHVCMHVDKQTV